MASKLTCLVLLIVATAPRPAGAQSNVRIEFAETADHDFRSDPSPDVVLDAWLTAREKTLVEDVIHEAERRVRALMPSLTSEILVTVVLVDRDLGSVGGVSGRAAAPGELVIELSTAFPGGVEAQLPALSRTLFHELHHLVRGWTIADNRFGPGIAIAAVNEGLAEVFAEEQTGIFFAAGEYPENAAEWAREVLSLPADANYAHWMFEHPDGRKAIGYRTGRYLVHRAMANSGTSVLALSELSPDEILDLAGVN